MPPDRQLLLAAAKALHTASIELQTPMLYHRNVEEARQQAQIALAKLTSLELQLRGVENPRVGE